MKRAALAAELARPRSEGQRPAARETTKRAALAAELARPRSEGQRPAARETIKRAALVLVAAFAGCSGNGPGLAQIDGALLAQADSVQDPIEGKTFVIKGDNVAAQEKAIDALRPGEVVRLAIDGEVPYTTVASLLARVREQHKRPVLLVGRRNNVAALKLSDPLEGPAVELIATIDGKACVRPPGSVEAGCVQTVEAKHIDRAYVRELVREARKAYDLSDVLVEVDPNLGWANVVRAIDGARTCCRDQVMRVALKNQQAEASASNP